MIPDADPIRILAVCTGNRARSQMAHGWLRHLGGLQVEVQSADTEPKGVHPTAIRVMAEVGVDISGHTSGHVDQYSGLDFDLVLTVCDSARERCPIFLGRKGSYTTPSWTPTGSAGANWTKAISMACSPACETR